VTIIDLSSLHLGQLIGKMLLRLLGVAATLLIGRALAGFSRHWMTRGWQKTGLSPSGTTLLVPVSHYSILLLAVMVALAVMGGPTTTIVGAAGIAVVVSAVDLQQSLGNLAATANFLLLKPSEVGDVIENGGCLAS